MCFKCGSVFVCFIEDEDCWIFVILVYVELMVSRFVFVGILCLCEESCMKFFDVIGCYFEND